MRAFGLFACLILAGCVTGPTTTKYQAYGDGGGYSEAKINDKIMVTRFAGNAFLRADTAQYYSVFRAIEICREHGYKVARLVGIDDKSSSQTVQRTANFNFMTPTQIYGNANSTTNYSGGSGWGQSRTSTNFNATATGGNQFGGSNTWNQTYNFPTFDTYFYCTNHVYQTLVSVKVIEPEEMKPFVKDLLGALQIQGFINDSPNRDVLQVGDLIIKAGRNRITNQAQFLEAIENAKDKSAISIRIVREGKQMTVTIKALETTKATLDQQNEQIGVACTVPEIAKRAICAAASQNQGE